MILLPAALCQPFALKQTLTSPTTVVPLGALSGNSECLIVASLNETISGYINDGGNFGAWEGWSYFHKDVTEIFHLFAGEGLSITDDGRQFLVSGNGGEFNFVGGGFYLPKINSYDGITVEFTTRYPVGVSVLTDDHLWVIASRQNGDVNVYHLEVLDGN